MEMTTAQLDAFMLAREIHNTRLPGNFESFVRRLRYLHRKVSEYSDRTGEGVLGAMMDLGLVDWIDEALQFVEDSSERFAEEATEESNGHC